MANMEYCRFQNTLIDLRDCYENFWDCDLSKEEHEARRRMLELCQRIVDEAEGDTSISDPYSKP